MPRQLSLPSWELQHIFLAKREEKMKLQREHTCQAWVTDLAVRYMTCFSVTRTCTAYSSSQYFKPLFKPQLGITHSLQHTISCNSLRVFAVSFLISKSRCFPNFSLKKITLLTYPEPKFFSHLYSCDIYLYTLNPIINSGELENKQTHTWEWSS